VEAFGGGGQSVSVWKDGLVIGLETELVVDVLVKAQTPAFSLEALRGPAHRPHREWLAAYAVYVYKRLTAFDAQWEQLEVRVTR
jgi:hypothetical protein